MRRRAAIGVDDDLAAGQAGVAVGTADEEFAGRIDVPDGLAVDPAFRQRLAHIGLDALANLVRGHVLDEVLVRDHDLAHADRLAVLVLHGDLALGVRAQHLLLAGVAGFGDQPQDLVGIEDRRRHQVRRFVGGVAEHDALVARAFFLVGARLQRIDALRDVGGLRMQQDFDVGGLPVEAFLLVADILDRGANDAFDLIVGDGFGAAGFAGDHHLVGGGKRFAGRADRPRVDAGLGAFAEKQIDDLVGNPVADLVRMAFGNRLAGEQIRRAHQPTPCCRQFRRLSL